MTIHSSSSSSCLLRALLSGLFLFIGTTPFFRQNNEELAVAVASAFVPHLIPQSNRPTTQRRQDAFSSLKAAPKRLEENVEGVVYVNDKCINCAACSNFAPSVFGRSQHDQYHIVHHQPSNPAEIMDARAAMAACPVAAIRSETLAQRRHRLPEHSKHKAEELWSETDEHLSKQMALSPKVNGLELPFPRPILFHQADNNKDDNNQNMNIAKDDDDDDDDDYTIYNLGHHNDQSFGATPYLLQAKVDSHKVWIMVDTPRYGKSAVDAVTQLTGPSGPDYLFLTHVDDTADHNKWVEQEFPSMKRIFHEGDTGRHNWLRDHSLNDVEILLPKPPDRPTNLSLMNHNNVDNDSSTSSPLYAYSIHGTPLPDTWLQDFEHDPNNNVVILHTPGHSPGSITLWRKPDHGAAGTHPGVIFTGDTYAYTTRGGGQMTGFPRYGNNLQMQATTLRNLLRLDWDIVAAGHGHPRDYTQENAHRREELKAKEMEQALSNLHK